MFLKIRWTLLPGCYCSYIKNYFRTFCKHTREYKGIGTENLKLKGENDVTTNLTKKKTKQNNKTKTKTKQKTKKTKTNVISSFDFQLIIKLDMMI